jgi:hypothetical protein
MESSDAMSRRSLGHTAAAMSGVAVVAVMASAKATPGPLSGPSRFAVTVMVTWQLGSVQSSRSYLSRAYCW